jgi:tRNA-i(6)A37 thiotransferase enzyme miaB
MKLPNYSEAKKRIKEDVIRTCFDPTDLIENIVVNKYYYIKTFGCQMNEHDSENISALVEKLGFIKTDDLKKADLVIINTCSIRENAHNKTFGFLGEIKYVKETINPNMIVALGGCMSQEEGVVKTIQDKYKWLNIVFGTHNIYDLPYLIEKSLKDPTQQIEVLTKQEKIVENIPVKRDSKYQAYVNIIYGCDKFCTYCIVPFTRGKELSRKEEDILEEIRNLKKEGYKEVTLLGQNVNAYGKDINSSLAKLLKEVDKIGIERVKFMTSHPWDFTDELVEVLGSSKNIMPFLHLPVQSGSNEVLRKMGRRYTKEAYLELVNKIKAKVPGIALTTDIIVGFPTETEEDFNETLDLVDKVEFSGAYTFIYSPRENTVAATFENTVSNKEAKRRLYLLNDKINYYSLKDNKKYQDKVVKVLILSESKNKNIYQGYTEHNKVINVESKENIIGQIVDVKVTEVKTWSLNGIKI